MSCVLLRAAGEVDFFLHVGHSVDLVVFLTREGARLLIPAGMCLKRPLFLPQFPDGTDSKTRLPKRDLDHDVSVDDLLDDLLDYLLIR